MTVGSVSPQIDLGRLRAIGDNRDLLGPAWLDPTESSRGGIVELVVLTSRVEWWEVHCLAITFSTIQGHLETPRLFNELADTAIPEEFPDTEFGRYVAEVGRVTPLVARRASRTLRVVLGEGGLYAAAGATPDYLECYRRWAPDDDRIRLCVLGQI